MAANALYIILVWVLTGMGFGLFSTAYGACRRTYRQIPGLTPFLDWFWFILAAVLFLVMAFWAEWGMFRIWAVVFILMGYGLWSWLAAPVVLGAFSLALYGQARLIYYILYPGRFVLRFAQSQARRMKKPPKKE